MTAEALVLARALSDSENGFLEKSEAIAVPVIEIETINPLIKARKIFPIGGKYLMTSFLLGSGSI